MEEEEWRKIDGFDNYSISNFGRVRNDNTKFLLKTHIKKWLLCCIFIKI